jgi:hypothetical protein
LKINILAKKAKNTVERSEIPQTCGEGVAIRGKLGFLIKKKETILKNKFPLLETMIIFVRNNS